MSDPLDVALQQAFPDRTVTATQPLSTSQHPGNETAGVSFASGSRAYLKVVADGRKRRVQRAVAALRYLSSQDDLRVPELLAAQTDREPYYLATAELDGEPLRHSWVDATTPTREAMVRAVGRAIARVHEHEFDRCGHISGGSADGLTLEEGTWISVLCETIEARAETMFSPRFEAFPKRVTRLVRDRGNRLSERTASLLHGDPNRRNCLVTLEGDETVELVDWEEALVGDPAFGLCRAEAIHAEQPPVENSERLREALYAGYRDVSPALPDGYERRRPLYRVVTFLKPAQTFELWAPQATESTAELEAWVREEMRRRIATARSAL